MNIINEQQGSAGWLAVRARFFTASEAPAALGLSAYTSRSELLRQKATGLIAEVDAFTQGRFDAGHAAEAATRAIAEAIIGENVYPVTGTAHIDGLPLLASFDGLVADDSVVWENKLWNDEFATQVRDCIVPDTHWPQIEQQLLISGASRALFTVSDGVRCEHVWYESVPARRAQLIAGWKQFDTDLANYQHVETAPAAVAAPVMGLPALSIQVNGSISLIDNLELFGSKLQQFIAALPAKPATDQEFADADQAVKTLKTAEEALDAAESSALAQTASIDQMRRTVALYRDQARTARLMLDKLVKARKESIKVEIMQEAKSLFNDHLKSLTVRLGKPYLPPIADNFAGVMKGLKTVTSLRNATLTELARLKIEANEVADRIEINLRSLRELGGAYPYLFADVTQLVGKANEDLVLLIKSRIADHEAAEAKKADELRQRIQAEEQLKAEARVRAEERKLADAAAETQRLQTERAAAEIEPQPKAVIAATAQTIESAPPAPSPDGPEPISPAADASGNKAQAGADLPKRTFLEIDRIRERIWDDLQDLTEAELEQVLATINSIRAARVEMARVMALD